MSPGTKFQNTSLYIERIICHFNLKKIIEKYIKVKTVPGDQNELANLIDGNYNSTSRILAHISGHRKDNMSYPSGIKINQMYGLITQE